MYRRETELRGGKPLSHKVFHFRKEVLGSDLFSECDPGEPATKQE
jgi:hypothetical protein